MPNHYDLTKVQEISSGDESFVKVIVETFLQEIPPDMEAMKLAIANNNQQMAYQFAHKMKPNLDMFGIDLLSDIAAMEKWSNSNKPASAVQSHLDKIIGTLTTVIGELQNDFSL